MARRFSLLFVLVLALAACGSDGDEPAGPANAGVVSEEAVAGDSTTTVPPASEPSTTATTVPESGSEPGTLLVLGQESLLADVLSLGLRPVAAGANVPESGFLGMGDLDTDGIEPLSLTTSSLEELAVYDADTVVTLALWVDLAGGQELIDGLADRVVVVPDNLPPAEKLAFLGRELGASAAADRLVAELEAAETEARAVMASFGKPCRLSIAAVYPGPSPAAFVAPVWELPATAVAIGCTLVPGPDEAAPDANGRAFLSLEQLALLDAETLVLLQSDRVEGEAASLAELSENPLWRQLPAVASGTVVELDRLGYAGVAGRIRFIDDLTAALQG